MGPTQRFFEYVEEFEKTYDDDDWSRLERFFAPDAVYEVRNTVFACRIEGPTAILRGIRKSLDGFDRLLEKRTLGLADGPTEDGDRVTFGWTATYDAPGAPPLVLRARSTARYRGDVIVELVDEYPDGMDAEAAAWSRAYAPGMDASYL